MTDANGKPLPGTKIQVFVGAIITLSFLAMAAIVAILWVRPDQDNTSIIVTILAFFTPLTATLLAAAARGTSKAVNGRMDQLLAFKEEEAVQREMVARAQGRKEGRELANQRTEDVVREVVKQERETS